MREEHVIRFKLNGKLVTVKCPPAYTLLEVLREQLQVTGPKEDCAKGECGACTVIMNGHPVCSCLVIISQANGSEIITSEGLMRDGKPNPVQKAFIDHGAVQCGHCIPGMIVSASALLMRNPKPTVEEIRTALSGNLCRCTGYTKIIAAVEDAARNWKR
ncbi:MAG TPA: (2Fe-2S)-binding protein [Candidatus Saccharimonadales bacterium]|nr:(2Fe-2S)-binding protein [Candidatus Saccharimonadales bacterium]